MSKMNMKFTLNFPTLNVNNMINHAFPFPQKKNCACFR